ncbi:MAG TPA: helix-turn-helix transcriptional regulator [Rubrobacter sp.]|nr:helix-turn-helix transcriptional regulator [Rubrobacter sp.]
MEAWIWGPEDLSLAVRFLRALRGWKQTRLAQEAGVDKGRISLLESGQVEAGREELQRLTAAVGFPFYLLEVCLPLLSLLRQVLPPDPFSAEGADEDGDEDEIAGAVDAVTEEVAIAARTVSTRTATALAVSPLGARWSYRIGDRTGVEELYRILERYTQDERLFLIKEGSEYQSWALAEKLCAESEECALAGDLVKALELAEAAVAITSFLPGPEEWRAHVEGYCRAFVSNVQRAEGRLDEAQHTYETAWLLWKEWTPDPALLQESRLRELGEALHEDSAAGEGP